MTDQQPEPFGVRIGPDGIVVTGSHVGHPVNTAESLDTLLAYAYDETGLEALDDARRMLHGVIVALEGAQRDRDDALATLTELAPLSTATERDEAREIARIFIRYTGTPCARWLFARNGRDGAALPGWLTGDEGDQP